MGSTGLTGLVVVDKEPGWTSHDVVARCRRLFGQRRVGHAGTLDPDASGLLLVGLGRFTRMLRFVQGLGKSYVGEVVLGTSTSTLDASGEVTGTWDMTGVTIEDARAAALHLTGSIQQVPPMVSAIKVDGKRLHALAATGRGSGARSAPCHSRPVRGGRAHRRARCDSDRGRLFHRHLRPVSRSRSRATPLGGGAHLRNLRRTNVGSFSLAEAHRLEELAPEHVLTPAQGLRDLQRLEISSETARRVTHGLPVEWAAMRATGTGTTGTGTTGSGTTGSGTTGTGTTGTGEASGPYAVVDRSGRLLAVYESAGPDRIVAACVLAS